ncbi:MAG: dehydrogenase, partial [Verrucomicrobia bacterium]|nr:dehydrogenase [Verrucomicrobiota bacterium]
MLLRVLVVFVLTTVGVFAQSGDKPGESQAPRVPKEKIPPAPPLKPADELKTFKLPPGFHAELVASDPMIETPIVMQWDADGRLWIVEMPSYMLTPAGANEEAPTGRISILEDTDGDGRMDKKTVFLDGLVMPRALALVHGGALVCEPPNLWFYPILPGLKPGNRVLVAKDYGKESDPALGTRRNLEHTANGLTWGLDNFIYSANYTAKFRRVEDEWKRFPTSFKGQWGYSQDDFGRPFYNSNSDQLRTDFVPAEYYFRNPYYRASAGLNIPPLGKDQSVWPSRVNPGVNRGYQEKQLRPDGTLATFTAVCGPGVYRGDLFPSEFRNNVFVCEPAGNIVRRIVLHEQDGAMTGENPYKQTEFMTSTDEIFRPVNAYSGPDGALYIVDMYHGIIQHRAYVTSYLRKQAEDRGLDKVFRHGRIWRIVPDGKKPGARPQLASASPMDLVKTLSHPNGWWRDTAQRLLVEQQPGSAIAPLKELAASGASPLARLHALWTLDGMGQLDAATVNTVLEKEQHSKVRAAAIRCCEPLLKTSAKDVILPKLLAQVNVRHIDVQTQLAFTLGQLTDPPAEAAMAQLAQETGSNPLVRDALVSGLLGREGDMIERIAADKSWSQPPKPGTDAFISALAKCVFTQARGERVNKLLTRITSPGTPNWITVAVL